MRTDVFTDEGITFQVFLELLNSISPHLLLDLLDLVKPDMCHLLSKAVPWNVVDLAVDLLPVLTHESNVLGADHPSPNRAIPGHLHILAISFQCFEDFYLVTLFDGL